MLDTVKHLDTELFLFLNQFHSAFWDKIMWQISDKLIWVPLYVLIIGYIIWKFKKKSVWIILTILLLITLSDQLSVQLFKNIFHRLRPCHNPSISEYIHLVNNYCGGKYGFVSSHAANTFALATFLSFLFKNKVIILLIFLWALIVSYSRIYLGVHFPGDIICGAMLGFILAFLSYYILKRNLNFY